MVSNRKRTPLLPLANPAVLLIYTKAEKKLKQELKTKKENYQPHNLQPFAQFPPPTNLPPTSLLIQKPPTQIPPILPAQSLNLDAIQDNLLSPPLSPDSPASAAHPAPSASTARA